MKWPFKCPPPPDLTCRLPIGWMTSEAWPAVAARGVEKWAHLKDHLTPKKPIEYLEGQDGSVLRFLGDQETQKGEGYGCPICYNFNCERILIPEAKAK